MIEIKIFVFMIACIGILTTTNSAAQSDNFTSISSNKCPNNYVYSSELNLCGTTAFGKPSFKKLKSEQRCASGYARLANSRLCLLDNKQTRVKSQDGRLRIVKAQKKQCGYDYIRLPNQNACVHKRIGLTIDGSKINFVQTAKLNCDSRNPESKSCKSKCAPGYFRSPELGMCVDFNAAFRNRTLIWNKKCQNPTHWRKLERSGVCVPRMVLSVVEISAGHYELEPGGNDTPICLGDAELQITSLVLGPVSDGTDSQSNLVVANSSFGIQPVIFCMVRPRPRK